MSKKIKPRRQRLYFTIFSLLCLIAATFLVLNAFRDNIVFFRTPTDLITKPAAAGEQLRVGGLVKAGSLVKADNGDITFAITDNANNLTVEYSGMLPSLFREGQSVVAYGSLNPKHIFKAREILAKHDEKYMPPEVYKELKERENLKK